MSEDTSREQALEAFGPILIKMGYEWVEIDKVAEAAALEPADVSAQFPNKVLLCEAWMEQTDERAKKHHKKLLSSGASSREVLDQYFEELEVFMEKHHYGGCPFSNTAQALQGRSEPQIESRVKEHKAEVQLFFRRLCDNTSFQPDILSVALFLIYSGATTESKNIRSMEPVKAGRLAALGLYDLYSVA